MGYSYKRPVKVNAAAVLGGIAIGVFGVTALSALGVQIAAALGNQDAQNFGESIMQQAGLGNYSPSVEKGPDGTYNITTTKSIMQQIANTFLALYQGMFSSSDIVKAFPLGHSFTGQYTASQLSAALGVGVAFWDGGTSGPKSLNNPTVVFVKSFPSVVGQSVNFHLGTLDSGWDVTMTTEYDKFKTIANYSFMGSDGVKRTPWRTNNSTVMSVPVSVLKTTSAENVDVYYLMVPYQDNNYSVFTVAGVQQTVGLFGPTTNVDKSQLYAQGKSVLNNDAASVIGKAYEQYRAQHADTADDGAMTLKLTGNPTKVDSKVQGQTQAQVLDGSIADTADITKNDATNAGKDVSVPMPDMPDLSLPTLITRKFPFSLPWDFAAVVGAFYPVERKAPYWEWPIENARLGIHEKIVIDFSKFEDVANVARWFEFAAYALGLILLTRKLTNAGGD